MTTHAHIISNATNQWENKWVTNSTRQRTLETADNKFFRSQGLVYHQPIPLQIARNDERLQPLDFLFEALCWDGVGCYLLCCRALQSFKSQMWAIATYSALIFAIATLTALIFATTLTASLFAIAAFSHIIINIRPPGLNGCGCVLSAHDLSHRPMYL